MNKEKKQIIFFTDISPDLPGSGSQHLKDILNIIDEECNLTIIKFNTNSVDYHRAKFDIGKFNLGKKISNKFVEIDLPTLFEPTPADSATQLAYLHRIRCNAYRYFHEFHSNHLEFLENTTIMIFVQWPGMLFLWEAFSTSNWKTVPILMDCIEPIFIAFKTTEPSKNFLENTFQRALTHSSGLLSGSIASAQSLSRQFKIPSREILSIFRHINSKNKPSIPVSRKNTKAEKTFILAGQIYAKDAVEIFLKGISVKNTRTNADDSFSLQYFGDFPIKAMYPTHENLITHSESISYEKLFQEVNQNYRFGLVPYSFKNEFSASAKFSFPSKLVFYVQAGLFPIYIGPRESSVYFMLQAHGLEKLCITCNNEIEVCEKLCQLENINLIETHKKLRILAAKFQKEYLQECISDVLNKI